MEEQALHLGEPREVTREQHAKGHAMRGALARSLAALSLAINGQISRS